VFGKKYVGQLIDRSAENEADRRRFLRSASAAGLGVVGAGLLAGMPAAGASEKAAADADAHGISDSAVLNFALNLEYLEAQFYSYAVYGHGLPSSMTSGSGNHGGVKGGHAVPFKTRSIREFATEIAKDEYEHVAFLRSALGGAKVSQPEINLSSSFTAAARAAGLVGPHQSFTPFDNENDFLLGAFLFEDVGVTAYKGAAPLISNKTYLSAAAGILAVEAYHAGNVRTALYEKGLANAANAISKARDSLDGPTNDDQGVTVNGHTNIVPADGNGLAFGRTPGQVLNIVYLTPKVANSGGFYPHGVNGQLHTSA
jgi:hypothetical protein